MKKICAGIVTYNADILRLKENISAVLMQISQLYIVDNDSNNYKEILELIKNYDGKIEIIKNDANMGIAYALNQLIELSREHYDWILTLDQDSVIKKGLIAEYLKYVSMPHVGLICCEITDRNYNLKTFNFKRQNYKLVTKCITSGTLTNIKACIESGGFDNQLFIDSVDYDLCYSMREHDYKTIKINFNGLLHEVGKSTTVSIGNIGFAVNNHPPIRKYYMSRNSIYLVKKHNLNVFTEYFVVYRRIFTVLFFENNKKAKIKSILKGIKDGKAMAKQLK